MENYFTEIRAGLDETYRKYESIRKEIDQSTEAMLARHAGLREALLAVNGRIDDSEDNRKRAKTLDELDSFLED